MIEVRVLTADDWHLWRDLRLAALTGAPAAFGSRLADWQGAGEDRWRQRLSLDGSHNLVAFLDGEAVGMASGAAADHAGVVELVSMWVAPVARGGGVADALVAAVERWAHTSGARELRLTVMEGNDRAAALYRRHGFVDSGDVVDDGQTREQPMSKTLAIGEDAPVPRIRQIVLDTTDARRSAEFWRRLLGLTYREGHEPPPPGADDPAGRDWLNLRYPDGSPCLACQQVRELPPASWPEDGVPQQLHLDLTVATPDELDAAHDRALSLGASVLADRSDDPDEPLRVYADPDGHPFCIFVVAD